MMTPIEQINQLEAQTEIQEDVLNSDVTEASAEQIQQLINLLFPAEKSTAPSTQNSLTPINSSEAINQVTDDGQADASLVADEIEPWLDWLSNLLKSSENGDFYNSIAINDSVKNYEALEDNLKQLLGNESSENHLELSEEDLKKISEFFQIFPGYKPKKKPEAVAEITDTEPWAETEFVGMNPPPINDLPSAPELQPDLESESPGEIEERREADLCLGTKGESSLPPGLNAELAGVDISQGESLVPPEPVPEPVPEPDLAEVARSLDFLRQMMFTPEAPQTTPVEVKEVKSEKTSAPSTEPLKNQAVSNLSQPEVALDAKDQKLNVPESMPEQHDFSAEIMPIIAENSTAFLANLNPVNQEEYTNFQENNPVQANDYVSGEALELLTNTPTNAPSSELEILQSLLVNPEVDPLRKFNKELEHKLSHIDQQIHNPENLINLLMPIIAELLSLKVEESKEDISRAIAPIIDQAIQERSLQDKSAMSAVLATLIPEAISYQIQQAPEDIAKAIAPEIAPAIREQIKLDRAAIANVLAPQMGEAIKEQIKLEQEAMVDALYPVIGATVARYIAEAIKDINEKIAKALSGQTIRRKILAKLHGVSEGELIFKEAIASQVQGVFLIHKQSGLIISEAQPPEHQLESEMVAGMLTAIRSFVNDCIVQSGEVAELNDIEYGLSTIKLEVAGYCYLAVLIKGDHPPKQLVDQIRKTLSKIVLYHSDVVQNFDGDPESVPQEIHQMLAELIAVSQAEKTEPLPLLQLFIITIVGLIFLSCGWNFYQSYQARKLETQILNALDANPELKIYPWTVKVAKDTVTVKSQVSHPLLRLQAENIVKNAAPNLKLNSQIIAPEKSALQKSVVDEVNRVAETLNRMAGISIQVKYVAGKVMVDGTVIQETDSQTIAQAFSKIPGVTSVVSSVQLQPLRIDTRIYFEQNSSTIKPEDVNTKLLEVQRFLTKYPQVHLNIVGHSDRSGHRPYNQSLALQRAENVKKALISMGIAPERLNISATPEPPMDLEPNQPKWQQRSVIFYPVISRANPHANSHVNR